MFRPHLASFDGLSFTHLCCADNSIHKETKDPHTNETERNNDDKKGTEPWNAKKDLQFIACGDDKQCEIEDDKKRLSKIESVFLSKEYFSPSGKTNTNAVLIVVSLFHGESPSD